MATKGGRFDFDDGGAYCGGWQDGKAHGVGVCTGPKGQGEYAGAFQNGFEVSGIYKWSTGSSYKGQWTQGKRHGYGVENKGRWLYQGEWTQGFKGRYGLRMSLSTGAKYEGTWTTGLQDGYGVETYADGGTYQGQWLRGIRHGYGIRQSIPYGLATLCRQKAGRESLTSLRSEPEEDHVVKERDRKMAELRSGFVLTAARAASETRRSAFHARFGFLKGKANKRSSSAEANQASKSSIRRAFDGLKLRKQKSEEISPDGYDSSPAERRVGGWRRRQNEDNQTLKSNISGGSFASSRQSPLSAAASESCASFAQDETIDLNAVETYSGEWKNDKRSGFGISKRTDGLMYEGEWENNKRHGYGVTTFKDGTREEGKYKNDAIVISDRNSKLLALRLKKLREHVSNAVSEAQRAAQQANSKSDMAISRMVSARAKAELAMQAAQKAQSDAEKAKIKAMEYAPEFMEEITKKEAASLPLLGLGGAAKRPNDLSSKSQDATSVFVSQFTDHYNADHHFSQVQSAKAFLNKAKEPQILPSFNDPSQFMPPKAPLLTSAENNLKNIDGLDKEKTFDKNLENTSLLQNQKFHLSQTQLNKSNLKSSKGGDDVIKENLDNVSVLNAYTQKKKFQFKNRFAKQPKQQSQQTLVQQNNLANNIVNINDALLSPLIESENTNVIEQPPQSLIDDHFDQYMCKNIQPTVYPNNNYPPYQQPYQGFQNPDFQANMQALTAPINNADFMFNLSNSTVPFNAFSYDNPQLLNNNMGGDEYQQQPDNTYDPSLPPFAFERRQTLPSGELNVIRSSSNSKVQQNKNNTPIHQNIIPSVRTNITSIPKKSPKNIMGSMPNVAKRSPVFVGYATSSEEPAMPREEVHYMSVMRREELRKLREAEERSKNFDLAFSFSDITNWCQQSQLLVFIVSLNLVLAAMFYNLLSR